jgi:hypothetical protein
MHGEALCRVIDSSKRRCPRVAVAHILAESAGSACWPASRAGSAPRPEPLGWGVPPSGVAAERAPAPVRARALVPAWALPSGVERGQVRGRHQPVRAMAIAAGPGRRWAERSSEPRVRQPRRVSRRANRLARGVGPALARVRLHARLASLCVRPRPILKTSAGDQPTLRRVRAQWWSWSAQR